MNAGNDVLNRFNRLRVWRSGSKRAPHKPLLLLLALGRLQRGENRLVLFQQIDEQLRDLLRKYSPHSKSYHSEYPFWRLQSDGIWEIIDAEIYEPHAGQTDAKRSVLLKKGARGGFIQEIHEALLKQPKAIFDLAQDLLSSHFPRSLHEEILDSTGVFATGEFHTRRVRDAKFRTNVLRAYEHRCAVCGYDLKVGSFDVGLEASHIRWHIAGGPDEVNNGLALCTFHHKAFDWGAFTLSEDHKILVSEEAYGSEIVRRMLLDFHKKRIARPLRDEYIPLGKHIRWHQREVFHPPWRD